MNGRIEIKTGHVPRLRVYCAWWSRLNAAWDQVCSCIFAQISRVYLFFLLLVGSAFFFCFFFKNVVSQPPQSYTNICICATYDCPWLIEGVIIVYPPSFFSPILSIYLAGSLIRRAQVEWRIARMDSDISDAYVWLISAPGTDDLNGPRKSSLLLRLSFLSYKRQTHTSGKVM